jgi:hypothetical protein
MLETEVRNGNFQPHPEEGALAAHRLFGKVAFFAFFSSSFSNCLV